MLGTVHSVLSQVKHDLYGLGLSRPQGSVKALDHFLLSETQSVGHQWKNVNLLVGQQTEAQRVLHMQTQQSEPGFQPVYSPDCGACTKLGPVQTHCPLRINAHVVHVHTNYLLTRIRFQLRNMHDACRKQL